MAETRKHRTMHARVDEAARDAEAQSGIPFAAAASLLSEDGSTVVTTASPGEIAQTQTSITALPDGSIATTVVTTTTVTTTTTTTTTTRAFLTGEIPSVAGQRDARQLQLPVIELESSQAQEVQEVQQQVQPQAQAQPQPQAQPQSQPQSTAKASFAKPLPYRFAKRAFDIMFSVVVIVVCFIPGLFLSIAVAISTKGSPFYTQNRIGQNGKRFRMYKFRTMVADSDNIEKYFTPKQLDEWHTEHKVKNDPRITPLGRFLRRTSIDEIPNFLNVFTGQMSVVGPRAITKGELHWFGDSVDEMLSVPAGITGWWQVESRNDATFKSGERQKLEMFYVRHASLSLDFHIMLRTARAMVSGTGV